MNPEIKALWLAALRSGGYKQTQGALCRVNAEGERSYCCLGVLTDLAEKRGIVQSARDARNRMQYFDDNSVNREAGVLLPSVLEWSGVDDSTGYLPRDVDGYEALTGLNDEGNYTFEQIADVIEEQF